MEVFEDELCEYINFYRDDEYICGKFLFMPKEYVMKLCEFIKVDRQRKYYNLEYCGLDDEACREISKALKYNNHISYITIGSGNITELGSKYLLNVVKFNKKNIRCMIHRCSFSTGIYDLDAYKINKYLKRLYINIDKCEDYFLKIMRGDYIRAKEIVILANKNPHIINYSDLFFNRYLRGYTIQNYTSTIIFNTSYRKWFINNFKYKQSTMVCRLLLFFKN